MSDAGTLARSAAFLGLAALAAGQEPTPKPSPAGEDEVVGLHFPQTAEDHLSVAEDYVKLAASHRKEADLHRRMLAAFERLVADLAEQAAPQPKPGITIPSVKPKDRSREPLAEYRAHCDRYIHGAELLADEAEKLAEFHKARARELREPETPDPARPPR